MEADVIFAFLKESLFLLIVLGATLVFGMIRGVQSLINLILALYLGLLLSIQFPYYERILGENPESHTVLQLGIFALFALLAFLIFNRLMPRDYERTFEDFGKKLAFAALATVLVMIFSFHVLPVTEFITPGTPIQALFGSEEYFFWWLLAPLIGLLLL